MARSGVGLKSTYLGNASYYILYLPKQIHKVAKSIKFAGQGPISTEWQTNTWTAEFSYTVNCSVIPKKLRKRLHLDLLRRDNNQIVYFHHSTLHINNCWEPAIGTSAYASWKQLLKQMTTKEKIKSLSSTPTFPRPGLCRYAKVDEYIFICRYLERQQNFFLLCLVLVLCGIGAIKMVH